MRGSDEQQGWMFSYISPEKRVPQDHPLRSVRTMVDEALRGMSLQFAKLYSRTGRPSVAPEKLIVHCCCRHCTRFAVSAC